MSLPTLVSPQALETLDNGKPYVISYLVDLDMVLKCLRYGLCFGHHEEGGRDVREAEAVKRIQMLTGPGAFAQAPSPEKIPRCQPAR